MSEDASTAILPALSNVPDASSVRLANSTVVMSEFPSLLESKYSKVFGRRLTLPSSIGTCCEDSAAGAAAIGSAWATASFGGTAAACSASTAYAKPTGCSRGRPAEARAVELACGDEGCVAHGLGV